MNDNLLFTENSKDAEKLINKLENSSLRYGLQLNKNKCNIMIINCECTENIINNIEVVNQIKYQGLLMLREKIPL